MPLAAGAAARGGAGGSSRSISAARRAGVIGKAMSATPSASATALARQTGVLMQLPSPTPLAPSGVTGDSVSRWRISGSGTSQAVGTR